MELCQDPQLRSLWPPATMATMPIQAEESFCCGIGGSTQSRTSASVSLKLKTEKGREETRRQEGIRFFYLYPNGYIILRICFHLLIRKSRAFLWGPLSDESEIWKETFICGFFLLALSSHFKALTSLPLISYPYLNFFQMFHCVH